MELKPGNVILSRMTVQNERLAPSSRTSDGGPCSRIDSLLCLLSLHRSPLLHTVGGTRAYTWHLSNF